MKSFVGNDVVDLAAAHNLGRARQARFLERVLTAAERGRMLREAGGDHGFALLWSAKEAAYKAAKKRDPALAFAPRRWQVAVDSLALPCAGGRGHVTLGDTARVDVRWQARDGRLHCIALIGDAPASFDKAVATTAEFESVDGFSERERRGFSCGESAAARSLAKRLLERRGVNGIEILRARRGGILQAPKVCVGESPLPGIDVSLSHDGRFVAAVVAIDAGGRATG